MLDLSQKKYVAERTKHYLRRIRIKNGWSQDQLAKSLKMSRTSVSAYENGKIERNKFVHACEVLWELAEVQGDYYDKFEDFLVYLFQLESGKSQTLNHWQEETLKSLAKLSPWIRICFTENILKQDHAEKLCKMLIHLSEFDDKTLDNLEFLISALREKKN